MSDLQLSEIKTNPDWRTILSLSSYLYTVSGTTGGWSTIQDVLELLQSGGTFVEVTDIVDNLTSGGTSVPLSAEQGKALKALIDLLQGSLIPQSTWDAATNTPDISSETTTGHFWIVSTAGITDISGITGGDIAECGLNDWIVKTATGWAKVDNSEPIGVYSAQFTSADVSGGLLTVAHNLNTYGCAVSIADDNGSRVIPEGIRDVNADTVSVDLSPAITGGLLTGTWRVTVVGSVAGMNADAFVTKRVIWSDKRGGPAVIEETDLGKTILIDDALTIPTGLSDGLQCALLNVSSSDVAVDDTGMTPLVPTDEYIRAGGVVNIAIKATNQYIMKGESL